MASSCFQSGQLTIQTSVKAAESTKGENNDLICSDNKLTTTQLKLDTYVYPSLRPVAGYCLLSARRRDLNHLCGIYHFRDKKTESHPQCKVAIIGRSEVILSNHI